MMTALPIVLLLCNSQFPQLAITLFSPPLLILFGLFQLSLGLLHEGERVTGGDAGLFPLFASRILISPNVFVYEAFIYGKILVFSSVLRRLLLGRVPWLV